MPIRKSTHRGIFIGTLLVLLAGGCPTTAPVNPFRDLPAITLDGSVTPLTSTIVPLGELVNDQVIRVNVTGSGIDAVLILAADETLEGVGLMAGGGLANTPFNYRINIAGRYFVFIQYDPALSASQRAGTIAVEPGDSAYSPPTSQPILIEFDAGYLHNPGLYDPQSQTLEEQAFLESLSDTVREGIVQRLRAIFQATPITILMQGDPLPAGPISRVIFSPLRILAGDQTVTDAALPPLDPTRPECQERVIFGEVLPRGANLDPGNRLLDDSAMVYVGSFQGRGETCQSAAINSVNNIVLGLSQTAAHEIGHLIGLYHVPLTDIMDRSPTQAFQRELALGRGQLLIDAQTISSTGTSEISTLLLTTVVQDPDFYFRANFTAMAQ